MDFVQSLDDNFYSLKKAAKILDVSEEDILSLASQEKLKLSFEVPKDLKAFTTSVNPLDKPNDETYILRQTEAVTYLNLTLSDIQELDNRGYTVPFLFKDGFCTKEVITGPITNSGLNIIDGGEKKPELPKKRFQIEFVENDYHNFTKEIQFSADDKARIEKLSQVEIPKLRAKLIDELKSNHLAHSSKLPLLNSYKRKLTDDNEIRLLEKATVNYNSFYVYDDETSATHHLINTLDTKEVELLNAVISDEEWESIHHAVLPFEVRTVVQEILNIRAKSYVRGFILIDKSHQSLQRRIGLKIVEYNAIHKPTLTATDVFVSSTCIKEYLMQEIDSKETVESINFTEANSSSRKEYEELLKLDFKSNWSPGLKYLIFCYVNNINKDFQFKEHGLKTANDPVKYFNRLLDKNAGNKECRKLSGSSFIEDRIELCKLCFKADYITDLETERNKLNETIKNCQKSIKDTAASLGNSESILYKKERENDLMKKEKSLNSEKSELESLQNKLDFMEGILEYVDHKKSIYSKIFSSKLNFAIQALIFVTYFKDDKFLESLVNTKEALKSLGFTETAVRNIAPIITFKRRR